MPVSVLFFLIGFIGSDLPSYAQIPNQNTTRPSNAPNTTARLGYRDPLVEARDMGVYIDRLQSAAHDRNFSGTFTVLSNGAVNTSRISHYVLGGEVYEQIELLDGAKRSQYRHNNDVRTVMPDQHVSTVESRPPNDVFPKLIKGDGASISQIYELNILGNDRVAGNSCQVAFLKARDGFRYGQRLWSDDKSGLLLKSQIIGSNGEVLEQVSFSEVSVNTPPTPERVKQTFKEAIKQVQNLHFTSLFTQKSTAELEGWKLNSPVIGFKEIGCFKRDMSESTASINVNKLPGAISSRDVLQWVFTDGLANVSVFVERYRPEIHSREGSMSMGATHLLTYKLSTPATASTPASAWWVTVLGEVPAPTLQAFAQTLSRIR